MSINDINQFAHDDEAIPVPITSQESYGDPDPTPDDAQWARNQEVAHGAPNAVPPAKRRLASLASGVGRALVRLMRDLDREDISVVLLCRHCGTEKRDSILRIMRADATGEGVLVCACAMRKMDTRVGG